MHDVCSGLCWAASAQIFMERCPSWVDGADLLGRCVKNAVGSNPTLPAIFEVVERRLRSSHRLKSDNIPYVTMVSSCALTARTDRESRVGKKRILNRIVKDRVPISQLNKVHRRSAESGTEKVARAGLDINDQYSLA